MVAMSQPSHLHVVDWAIIGVYACSTLALGWYYGRKQRDTDEYFVGHGGIHPFFIGVSLFATLLSTVSYLSAPGEAVGKGPVGLFGWVILPLIYVVVAYGLLPIYMKQRVTSAYELLEVRLGLSVRLLGATMFLALRLVWMTLLVYLAAKAMTIALGVDAKWVPLVVLITGVVSVIYTTMGGLRAVVITDFMQALLLLGGAWLVIAIITWEFGGFDWFPRQWQSNWDRQPIFSFDPETRITLVGTIVSMTVWFIATAGGDQTSVQRFMATRDLKAARRAYAVQLSVTVVVLATLFLVGFALLGYYQVRADELPANVDLGAHADQVFPHFIGTQLPVGIAGLVVAAMFAAAMSSIDSGVNSVTAVVMTDFLDRFGLKPRTETGHVRIARALALAIGLVVVLGSSSVKLIEGNITAVTNKTVNLLVTPIFILFALALFVRRATALGAWVATICGVTTAVLIAFSGPIVTALATGWDVDPAWFGVELITETDAATGLTKVRAPDPVSFQWIGLTTLIVGLTTGILVSHVDRRLRRVAKAEETRS